jgi:hypothetical protein
MESKGGKKMCTSSKLTGLCFLETKSVGYVYREEIEEIY